MSEAKIHPEETQVSGSQQMMAQPGAVSASHHSVAAAPTGGKVLPPAGSGSWSAGLFDCFGDIATCNSILKSLFERLYGMLDLSCNFCSKQRKT